MPEPFIGAVPDDRLYDPEHDMWVMREGDAVVVGATAFGVHLAGRIIAFTGKPRGAQVARGRGLGTVECAKTVLAVHAPLSFTLDAINEALEAQPDALNADAWSAWMARGMPTDWAGEAPQLVDAAAYRAHIRRIDPQARVQ